jgi:hypothetical protein
VTAAASWLGNGTLCETGTTDVAAAEAEATGELAAEGAEFLATWAAGGAGAAARQPQQIAAAIAMQISLGANSLADAM